MARITKAVLEAQVVALSAMLEHAQAALDTLERENDALRQQADNKQFMLDEALAVMSEREEERQRILTKLDTARAEAAAHSTPSRRVAYAMPAWQAERAAAMAAAKALAMATGRVVRA